tara:strand:- start:84 stop:623 length:540 start_codon:yes stop_codon:yes gene_type:complete
MIEVKDANEVSGWLNVEVTKVRKATFDVSIPNQKTQKIHFKSKDWRPKKEVEEEEAHSSPGSRLPKCSGDLVATATAMVEEIDWQATKARAEAFRQKRAELDTKIDPMSDDADAQYVANVTRARKHAQGMYPSNEKTTKIKRAIANVNSMRAELAAVEAELEELLSDESPTKKKQKRLE